MIDHIMALGLFIASLCGIEAMYTPAKRLNKIGAVLGIIITSVAIGIKVFIK